MAVKQFVILVLLLACVASIPNNFGTKIYTNSGGNVVCDNYVCPNDSVSCEVRQTNNPENQTVVDVIRKCFDSVGKVTGQSDYTFEDTTGQLFNNYFYSGASISNGGSNDSEVVTNITKTVDKIENDVATTLNSTLEQLKQKLNRIGNFFGNLFQNFNGK